ncbi:MAG: hypothetical protein WC919_00950 [Candidatus Paceibacterota bacterium]
MPNFSKCCDHDEYICQVCGKSKCSKCHPPVWVDGRGNVCSECQRKSAEGRNTNPESI